MEHAVPPWRRQPTSSWQQPAPWHQQTQAQAEAGMHTPGMDMGHGVGGLDPNSLPPHLRGHVPDTSHQHLLSQVPGPAGLVQGEGHSSGHGHYPDYQHKRRRHSNSRSRSRSRERHWHRRSRSSSRSSSRGRRSHRRSRHRSSSRSRSRRRRRSRSSSRSRSRSSSRSGRHSSRRRRRHRSSSTDRDSRSRSSSRRRRYDDRRHASREGSSGREWQHQAPDVVPTATLFVKGLPDSCQEAELLSAFSPFQNVTSARVIRKPGKSTIGFVDFASIEDARAAMDSPHRRQLCIGSKRLLLDYAQSLASDNAVASGGDIATCFMGTSSTQQLDWICDMCSAVNYARRAECYVCSSWRPQQPRRVTADTDGPSNVLKVSGLEPTCDEEGLRFMFSALLPVLDVRLVRDRYTGQARGFAFVEFASIDDATRALNALQGAVPEGQTTPVKLCYARERLTNAPAAPAYGNGVDAAAAAQMIEEVSGWAPKEFTEDAVDPAAAITTGPGQTTRGANATAITEAAGAAHRHASHIAVQEHNAHAQTHGSDAQPNGISHAPSDSAAALSGADSQADYIYDPQTGYYYVPSTGAYYDGNTGYFYFPSSGQWMSHDVNTGQYIPVQADAGQPAFGTMPQQASSGLDATHNQGLAESGQLRHGTQLAVATKQGLPQGSAVPKRKGAVIGAAPQYNPHGLLLAAQAIKDAKATAQAKATTHSKTTTSGKPASGKPASGTVGRKPPMPTINKGAAAHPGLGSLPHPSPPSTAATSTTINTAANLNTASAASTGASTASAAAPAAIHTSQGVIYRGKWSQRTDGSR